jgi:Ca-activated chloride channel family protein
MSLNRSVRRGVSAVFHGLLASALLLSALLAAALVLSALLARPVQAQGWIEPLPGRPIPLGTWAVEKTRSQVRVTVEGRVARVVLTEWFKNEGNRVAEGDYLYPLPGEAAFSGFSLWQGEDELRGEMMDREHAREIYEEIVRRRADPALIELAGHGLLRARVFPIEPGQERKVELRFTQLLDRSGDALRFRYSGAIRGGEIGPRPRQVVPERDGVRRDERSRDDRRRGVAETDFRMVVERGNDFLDPFSPTHGLERTREGGRLEVRLSEALEGELSVFLPLAREGVGLTVAAHRPAGEAGFAMLTLTPGRLDAVAEPRDVTVVVDVSGSMAGEKMAQARAALVALLETLDAQDRFRLLSFSNAVHAQSEGWTPARPDEVARAQAWVERLDADGGTNISGALDEAFRVAPGEGRLPVVIFLTDGLPTVGERDPERIAVNVEQERGRARVFAFGVGHDVNTHLLDRLSVAARGATDYVQPGESVERALSLLAAKIRHPVLTDLEIAGAPVRLREIYPVHLPDLFAGQELVPFARYEGQGEGELAVTGRRAGRSERFAATASFPRQSEDNAYLPRLWASRKLGHLTRQVWLEGPTPSLVEEIKQTALRYGLPSEYTAYLVREPEMVAGNVRGAVGGRQQANAFRAPPPPSAPAEAQGAGAVASAARARRLRDASTSADLAKLESAEEQSTVAGTRQVAGRLFQERDGVWMEAASSAQLPLVTVKLFSRAWFDLLAALPEVAQAARELGRVELAGTRVRIRVDSEGLDQLMPEQLAAIARGFRGVTP